MPFWLTLLLFVGTTVIGELLRPRPKFGKPSASSLGDFDLPTAQEGRPIPLVFGTCNVRGPNVTWFGDLVVAPITEKIDGGLFGSDKTVTKGYSYYMSMMLGISNGPIDALIEIRADDRPLPGSRITVNSGNKTLTFNNGGGDQTINLTEGDYDTEMLVAAEIESKMKAAIAEDWRVMFGWVIVAGVNDELWYDIRISGVSSYRKATILPGRYSDSFSFSRAIAAAIEKTEATSGARRLTNIRVQRFAGNFEIIAEESGLALDYLKLMGLQANGMTYAKTALPALGFTFGADHSFTQDGTTWEVRAPQYVDRAGFIFAKDGSGATLKFSSSTLRQLVFAPGVDKSIGYYQGGQFSIPSVSYQDSGDFIRCSVNAFNLYGGEDTGGGVGGTIDVYKGNATQAASADLLLSMNADRAAKGLAALPNIPNYYGLCYAVARRLYIGTSNYPRAISFVVRKCPNELLLTGGKHNINGDANPAAVLYFLLTDTTWGLGIPAGLLDVANFRTVGDTLFTESLGISFSMDSPGQAGGVIDDVLRTIDGVIYEDPVAGLISLKLARDDYSVGALPLFNEDNLSNIEFERPSWEETRNIIRVRYIDRDAGFIERVAQAHDLANMAARGGEQAAEEVDYTMLSNAAAAQKAAGRALKAMSYPTARVSADADRSAWALRPGSVVRVSTGELGITDLPMRVTKMQNSEIEQGKIRLTLVEDIFGIAWVGYEPPLPPDFVDLSTAPLPLLSQVAMEVPYGLIDAEDLLILTMGVPGAGYLIGYEVWVDPLGGEAFVLSTTSRKPTPSGIIVGNTNEAATSFTVEDGPLMASLASISAADLAIGRNLAWIGGEFIVWKDIDQNADGTWTISGCVRGQLDTTPKLHLDNARLYFAYDHVALARPTSYPLSATITLRLLAFNRRGAIAIVNQSSLTVATGTVQRSAKPLAPCQLKLNGVSYPTNISGDLVVSWEHRNRLLDWSYADSGKTATAEAGLQYRVKIYGEDGLLKHTSSLLANTVKTYTYTLAQELIDNGLGRPNATMRVVVEALFGSVVSEQGAEDTVDAGGWTMLWGEYWGGTTG